MIKRDKKKKIYFASLQGETAAKTLKPDQINSLQSVILKSSNEIYENSTASIRCISLMGGPYKIVLVLLIFPPFIRNWVYRFVAKNRLRWFGKRETCRVPSEDEKGNILP